MTVAANFIDNIEYPRTFFRFRKYVNADIDKLLSEFRNRITKGLHLGAGSSKLPGLLNCDLFNPEADLKVDATNLGMFDDESIDLIESHHMIEHLSFSETERALSEWRRVLRPRGLLVITCPDILRICLQWFKYSSIYPLFPCPEKIDYMVKTLVGSQEREGEFHKNAFDIRRMSRLLSKYGFKIEFTFSPYPLRPTPSMLVIARKTNP
ncbi:MAG: methyltransferase domain-containing protein [Syntrophales bacterium]